MWKKLKTVHNTNYGSGKKKKISYGRSVENTTSKRSIRDYMSGKEGISFTNYGRDSFTQLNMNLKDFNAKYTKDNQLRVGNKFYEIESGLDENVSECINEISKYIIKQKSSKDNIKDITSKLSEGIKTDKSLNLNMFLGVLSATAIFFAFSESTITGNTISSGLSTTSNGIGLTICLLGILALTLYKKFK